MVTGLFAGQHNTALHGTITGVIFKIWTFCKKSKCNAMIVSTDYDWV